VLSVIILKYITKNSKLLVVINIGKLEISHFAQQSVNSMASGKFCGSVKGRVLLNIVITCYWWCKNL